MKEKRFMRRMEEERKVTEMKLEMKKMEEKKDI